MKNLLMNIVRLALATPALALAMTIMANAQENSSGNLALKSTLIKTHSTILALPITNLAFNSTAKTGQMESGTGTWMRRNLAPGIHYVRVGSNVNDSNGDGFTSGYIGDRSLVVRVYSNQ